MELCVVGVSADEQYPSLAGLLVHVNASCGAWCLTPHPLKRIHDRVERHRLVGICNTNGMIGMALIIDAHLDLAWNAMGLDRDLLLPLDRIKNAEASFTDGVWRGNGTLCLPQMRLGRVAVAVGTLLARSGPDYLTSKAVDRTEIDHVAPHVAHATACGQLAWYEWLEGNGHVRIIRTGADLEDHWRRWVEYDAANPAITAEPSGSLSNPTSVAASPDSAYTDADSTPPIGLIISMEGADPITRVEDVDVFYKHGLRAVGLAHYGRSRHAGGTSTTAPLTPLGIETLRIMSERKIALDVTHLSDESLEQAIDIHAGPVLASHHNCRVLAPHQRQLPDAHIREIAARGGVMGLSLNTWMIVPGWKTGETVRESVTLRHAVQHVDHICQVTGSADHVGIGSDLDGGFGSEEVPAGIDCISQLNRLGHALADINFTDEQIAGFLHGNWLRFWVASLGD